MPDYDPHQLFITHFSLIGDDIRNYYPSPSGVVLDNGLIEITRKLIRRNCILHYQYDPKTFIVKSWRWEGDECVSNP